MGLDITAYGGCAVSDNATQIMNHPEPREAAYHCDCDIPYHNPDFPGRADDIERQPYRARRQMGFRAGSYSGYNQWRRELAAMVGIHDLGAFWRSPDMCIPFAELINFSDCEGTIGTKVSQKLANDFKTHRDKAVAFSLTTDCPAWIDLYADWQRAFEMASDGGYVSFH